MDTRTMLHAGAEFLALTTLFIWTKKRLDTINSKVDSLMGGMDGDIFKRLDMMEQHIVKQNIVINELQSYIIALKSSKNGQPRQPLKQEDSPAPSRQNNIKTNIDVGKTNIETIENDEETEVQPDIEVVDDMLKNELSELVNSRESEKEKKKI